MRQQLFLSIALIFAMVLTINYGEEVVKGDSHPLVECETTKGTIVIEVIPEWAPIGAQHFLELVEDNFYTNIALYRCVRRFLVQFGISDNPSKRHWHRDAIIDDPSLNLGIKKNYVSFAGGGPNTRTSQIFIAFEDLDFLGKEPWETPFGKVIKGQEVLDHLYKDYGDIPPFGNGPDQVELFEEGNEYIHRVFPQIDFLHTCSRLTMSLEEEKDQITVDHLKARPIIHEEQPLPAAPGNDNDDGNGEKEREANLISAPEAEEGSDSKNIQKNPDLIQPEDLLFNNPPESVDKPVTLLDSEEKTNLRRTKPVDASIILDHSAALLNHHPVDDKTPTLSFWQLVAGFVILSAVILIYWKFGHSKAYGSKTQ